MIGAARNSRARWRCAHDSDVGLAKALLIGLGEEALERLAMVKQLRRALSDAEQERRVCEREAVAARLTASFLLEELKQEERLIENLRQRFAKASERNRELAKELADAKAYTEQVEASFRGAHCTKCGAEALDFRKEGDEFLCIMCTTDRAEAKGREAATSELRSPSLKCRCQWEAGDSPCPMHGENEVEPADSTRRTLPPGADAIALLEAANG